MKLPALKKWAAKSFARFGDMSRIGKRPVKITQGVKVNYKAPVLEVSGKLGTLKRTIPERLNVEIAADEIRLTPKDEESGNLHGLYRTLIKNMVHGVSEGFSRHLELQGVGYRATTKGDSINLQVGFSHPVDFPLPAGVKAKVEASTQISITGADKELLGELAANLRKIRPPEPYKGKGIRYKGEHITLKQGKAAAGKA